MHTTIDYSRSPAPRFDAVQDIKDYLGPENWQMLLQAFRNLKCVSRFQFYCNFIGVSGFPVRALYDFQWGQGAWDKAQTRALIAKDIRIIRKACPGIDPWDVHVVVAVEYPDHIKDVVRELACRFNPTANVYLGKGSH